MTTTQSTETARQALGIDDQQLTAAEREMLRNDIRHLVTGIDAGTMIESAENSIDVWRVTMPYAGRCVDILIALPLRAAVVVEEYSEWTIKIG